MDLSGALPEEIILEVYDEELVRTVEYEHIPFRCYKFHEHSHLFRDYSTNNMEGNGKTPLDRDHEGFTKVGGRGKGGKQRHKNINEDRYTRRKKFKILEEVEDNMETVQDRKNVFEE